MKTLIDFLNDQDNTVASLTDAKFTSDRISQINALYGKLFGEEFGGDFKVVYKEEFKSSDGREGIGYRMFNPQGYQLRFSFNKDNITASNAKNTLDTFVVDSIDFWDKNNTELDKPSFTCTFSSSRSVEQIFKIYKNLCNLFSKGETGTFGSDDLVPEKE